MDHDGECKLEMVKFLDCLGKNKNDHFPCKAFSKSYLQCRMDNGLMAKEELSKLGLGESDTNYKRIETKVK